MTSGNGSYETKPTFATDFCKFHEPQSDMTLFVRETARETSFSEPMTRADLGVASRSPPLLVALRLDIESEEPMPILRGFHDTLALIAFLVMVLDRKGVG